MTAVEEGDLLVPTERHVESALDHGARRARAFGAFVEDLAARLAPDVALAGPHTTRLLTREALSELGEGRLRTPEEPAAVTALAHAVDRALGRLRRAGTEPAHLHAVGTPYATLLADLLDRVDGMLARAGLADVRSAGTIVARRISAARVEELTAAPTGRVVVSGMASLEPDDLGVIEALHARLREAGGMGVTFELPRLAGPIARAPDDATGPVADDLERRWASLLDPPEIDWRATRAGIPSLVCAARDPAGQARAATAAILAAVEGGTPPERIAIVVPELDEALLEPLRSCLGDARVPFCEPRGRPTSSCPEGRIALGLLAVAAGPVTREQVIELLRAPGIDAGWWTERAGDREAAFRAAALAHRLREVPVEIDRTGRLLFEALADHVGVHHPDEAWMLRTLDRLLASARWLGEGAVPAIDGRPARAGSDTPSRRELARRLLTLLDRLKLGAPPLRELGAALRGDGRGAGALPLRALGEGAAAVRGVREAVRAIVEGAAIAGLADRPSSVGDFGAELELAARELGVGLGAGPAASAAVRIGRAGEIAGLDHDLVVVMGLDERAYSGAEGDLALLDERIRRRLPIPCRPPSSREREAWRRAELAWAIAGSDRVVLCHTAGEIEASGTPHRLVRWAQDLNAEQRTEPASRVARGASRIDARSAELCGLVAGAPPRPEIAERAAIERARTAFFLDPRAPSDTWNGRVFLGDDAARRRLVTCVGGDMPERTVAVTAIERAAGCAFAGFARRVLRIRRTDDLGESADARERGTLVHHALHAAFEGARDCGSNDWREVISAARAKAERELLGAGGMAPLRREAVSQAIADAIGVVMRSLEAGDDARFLAGERRFGNGEIAEWASLPLAPLDGGAEVVWIDGQIDRIDVSRDGRRARVVDYKTGRIPAADDHGKSAFQLPLYAAVAARALGCDDVEAEYVSVRQRGAIDEWPRTIDDRRALGARRGEIGEAARRVIVGMWQGELGPRPAKAALCTRCEARDVCRRPAVAPIEEAEDR